MEMTKTVICDEISQLMQQDTCACMSVGPEWRRHARRHTGGRGAGRGCSPYIRLNLLTGS